MKRKRDAEKKQAAAADVTSSRFAINVPARCVWQMESEEGWDAEAVLDERINEETHETEYLVKWVGFTSKSNTWEPAGNLEDTDVLAEYNWKRKRQRRDEPHREKTGK